MVFVNSQKFACESCIKGHRSSSCAHTDRPLFEIKKKGRPVSQCERCRELRSTKRVHSKCTCSEGKATKGRETEKAIGTKQKRYIPIVPALPNGLKDAFPNSTLPTHPSNPRQKVDSLLNPCPCADVWNCQCRASTSATLLQDAEAGESSGLATLAKAAAMYELADAPSRQTSPTSSARDSSPTFGKAMPASTSAPSSKHNRPPTPPPHPPPPETQQDQAAPPVPRPRPSSPPLLLPRPDIPGTVTFAAPSLQPTLPPPPAFPGAMPPFSAITSLAGSGCTCGLRCSCPDCASTAHPPRAAATAATGVAIASTRGSRRSTSRASGAASAGRGPVRERGLAQMRWSASLRMRRACRRRVGRLRCRSYVCGGSCGCENACGCGNACDGCCGTGEKEDAGDAGNAEAEERAGSSGEAKETEREEERVSACCC